MRQPDIVAGQGTSPYAYYRQANDALFDNGTTTYDALETHAQVADRVIHGGDILVADTALYGDIAASKEVMPDVFKHRNLMAYGAAILDVVFHKGRHPDVKPANIFTVLTQEKTVEGHCSKNIENLAKSQGGKLNFKYVADSGLAAEVLSKNGLVEGEPAYAICNKLAIESCGLIDDGVMSDNPGATRFIAYNNEGYFDPNGTNISVAIRTLDTPHALLDAVKAGFKGINLASLVQLNDPVRDGYADFAIEFVGVSEDIERVIGMLTTVTNDVRLLGRFTPIDKREDTSIHGDFNYNLLASGNDKYTTICLDMNDRTGGLVEKLERIQDVSLHGIRISTNLKSDFSKVLALDIEPKDLGLVKLLLGDESCVILENTEI